MSGDRMALHVLTNQERFRPEIREKALKKV